ncbi:hypothetical protein Aperf_G00000093992 [Anoplocephala perfoliata]
MKNDEVENEIRKEKVDNAFEKKKKLLNSVAIAENMPCQMKKYKRKILNEEKNEVSRTEEDKKKVTSTEEFSTKNLETESRKYSVIGFEVEKDENAVSIETRKEEYVTPTEEAENEDASDEEKQEEFSHNGENEECVILPEEQNEAEILDGETKEDEEELSVDEKYKYEYSSMGFDYYVVKYNEESDLHALENFENDTEDTSAENGTYKNTRIDLTTDGMNINFYDNVLKKNAYENRGTREDKINVGEKGDLVNEILDKIEISGEIKIIENALDEDTSNTESGRETSEDRTSDASVDGSGQDRGRDVANEAEVKRCVQFEDEESMESVVSSSDSCRDNSNSSASNNVKIVTRGKYVNVVIYNQAIPSPLGNNLGTNENIPFESQYHGPHNNQRNRRRKKD